MKIEIKIKIYKNPFENSKFIKIQIKLQLKN